MFVRYTFQTIYFNLMLCIIKAKEKSNEIIYIDPLLTRSFLKHMLETEREIFLKHACQRDIFLEIHMTNKLLLERERARKEREREDIFSLQSLTNYLAQANKHCPGKSIKLCCRPSCLRMR